MSKAKTCIIALLALVVVIASVVAVFIVTVYKTTGDSYHTVANNKGNDQFFVNKTCNENETVNDVFRVHLGCDALKNISNYENGTNLAKDMFKNFFF